MQGLVARPAAAAGLLAGPAQLAPHITLLGSRLHLDVTAEVVGPADSPGKGNTRIGPGACPEPDERFARLVRRLGRLKCATNRNGCDHNRQEREHHLPLEDGWLHLGRILDPDFQSEPVPTFRWTKWT